MDTASYTDFVRSPVRINTSRTLTSVVTLWQLRLRSSNHHHIIPTLERVHTTLVVAEGDQAALREMLYGVVTEIFIERHWRLNRRPLSKQELLSVDQRSVALVEAALQGESTILGDFYISVQEWYPPRLLRLSPDT
ncbi:MAG: hypothetical protein WAT84_01615 [Candidatus Moraniibacteriota bacterium]